VFSTGGAELVQAQETADRGRAAELGAAVAASLDRQGAREIIADAQHQP
jgi:hypothetical protein